MAYEEVHHWEGRRHFGNNIEASHRVLNIQVINIIDYQADMTEHISKKKRCDDNVAEWNELNAKGYSLVLQHCHPELMGELKNDDTWPVIEDKRSVVMAGPPKCGTDAYVYSRGRLAFLNQKSQPT